MRQGFLRKNYSLCWKFFKESSSYIIFSLAVFCFLFIIGFAFPLFFRAEIFMFLEELVTSIEGKSTFELISFIFLNNIWASFLAVILGIGFGIFPLVVAIINGYLLGFVAREAVAVEGIFVLWRLAPHGIFELPAIIFSIGIGLKIGVDLSKYLFFSNINKNKLRKNYIEALRFFLFVIFPLLLVAGIIEGILIGSGI